MKYWLRNSVYLTAMVIALPWLLHRSWRTGRYRRGLFQRLRGLRAADVSPANRPPAGPAGMQGERLWFHGVSVGEIQLLAPLIRQLQHQSPESKVVISTTTESGMELATKLLPDVDRFFFPLDFSWAVQRALRVVRPTKIILAELELWPNLIDLAHQGNIALIVVNGRLSDRSFRGYQRLSWLTRGMFRKLSHVTAQTQRYAERFEACGCPPEAVTVSGSLKFDNVHFQRATPEISRLRSLIGLQPDDRVCVVGSSQSPEELESCQAFVRLREEWPCLKLIVVPRHPERFDAVDGSISQLPVRYKRRSELVSPLQSSDWEILLVDTIGELRWWWGLAEIAIVGGSFGARGGQNMLEPAAYGANVAFGPNTSNFKDVVELLLDGSAASRIPDLASIETWIRQQLQGPELGLEKGRKAREIIASQQGATARTLQVILTR